MKFISKFILSFILIMGFIPNIWAASNLLAEFHGIQGEELKNVQARLAILISTTNGQHFSTSEVKEYYRKAPAEIKLALQPYGYFKPRIHSRLIRRQGCWIALFDIEPGPILTISDITIKLTGPGRANPVINDYIARFPLKAGEPFNGKKYEAAKTSLFKKTRGQGYLKAAFNNQVLIDLKKYRCHIKIALETGPLFYFGDVTFENQPYSLNFLRRIVKFEPNEPFSSMKLLKLQQRMEKSYYFTEVVITPDFINTPNNRVPLRISMTPPKARRYSAGLGYSTLSGTRITGAISLRHIGNEGHHFESELRMSRILSGITGTYFIPGNDPLTEEWLMGAAYKTFEPKSGKSISTTLTAGYAKKLDNTQLNLNLNYLYEKFSIYSYNYSAWQNAHQLYPNFKVSVLKADNVTNPQNGYSLSLNLQGSHQAVASSTSFGQAEIRARAIVSPVTFARIIVRGQFGATAVNKLSRFPFSLRYFAGGVNSIRGFADSSIGPGKYIYVGSVEYQNKLFKENLYGAVFYDAGTATNHTGTPLNRGAGVGAVYNTPIGPIKLYLARAISKTTQPYSVEFSVGPELA